MRAFMFPTQTPADQARSFKGPVAQANGYVLAREVILLDFATSAVGEEDS